MKRLYLYIFTLFFLMLMELVFRDTIFNHIFNLGILNIFVFSIPLSLIIYLLTNLFNEKVNKILYYVMLISLIIIFIAQIIYYKHYESIFSIYSIKEGGINQIAPLMVQILTSLYHNIFSIIFLILPLIFFIIFNKPLFDFKRNNIKIIITIILLIPFTWFGTLKYLNINKNDIYSPYNLYYNTHAPTLMAKELGLLTSMRLDTKRYLFGFTKDEYEYIPEYEKPEDKEDIPIIYNTLDIDFNSLISNENNATIKNMHTYFNNQQPTNKNDYTGMFKGKNLILILAESLDPIGIDEKITPTLYKLQTEGFNFTNFYTPLFPVSTSDGEYISRTSLIPKEGVWSLYRSYQNYLPFTLGNMFKKEGYKTTSYHNHYATYYKRNLSHPNLGYEKFIACRSGLNINCKKWPESDLEMIDVTTNDYLNSDTPFLTYYITVSGHLEYNKWNAMAIKNWHKVNNLSYSTPVKAYLSCHVELDRALELLIQRLEQAKQLEDTVIVISSDHYPYGLTLDQINEKSTYIRDDNFDKHHLSFIVWNSEMGPETIDTLSSSIDILPTVLNLFGMDYDSRLLMGKDIFSVHESLVIFSNRSWISDKGRYNTLTKKFTKTTDLELETGYVDNINKIIYDKFNMSELILDNDYYKKVFK